MTTTPQPTPLPVPSVPPAPPAPYGGYALASVKQHEGRDGTAFTAVITKDGQKVISVRNEGCGGCNFYDFVGTAPTVEALSKVMPAFRAHLADFEAFAKTWNEGTEFAGIEDADALVSRLLEVQRLSRMRSLPFVLDGADPWEPDAAVLYLRGASREQALAMLRQPPYAERNPRVWDRDAMAFVPVN